MDFAIGSVPAHEPTIVEKLREMMNHVSDSDRCTLCKAAEMLEKPNSSSNDWYIWIVIIFMLVGGWGGDSKVSLDFLKSYVDMLEKSRNPADNEDVKDTIDA